MRASYAGVAILSRVWLKRAGKAAGVVRGRYAARGARGASSASSAGDGTGDSTSQQDKHGPKPRSNSNKLRFPRLSQFKAVKRMAKATGETGRAGIQAHVQQRLEWANQSVLKPASQIADSHSRRVKDLLAGVREDALTRAASLSKTSLDSLTTHVLDTKQHIHDSADARVKEILKRIPVAPVTNASNIVVNLKEILVAIDSQVGSLVEKLPLRAREQVIDKILDDLHTRLGVEELRQAVDEHREINAFLLEEFARLQQLVQQSRAAEAALAPAGESTDEAAAVANITLLQLSAIAYAHGEQRAERLERRFFKQPEGADVSDDGALFMNLQRWVAFAAAVYEDDVLAALSADPCTWEIVTGSQTSTPVCPAFALLRPKGGPVGNKPLVLCIRGTSSLADGRILHSPTRAQRQQQSLSNMHEQAFNVGPLHKIDSARPTASNVACVRMC